MMRQGKVIRSSECPPVAWKNGGGSTRELAVSPHDAGADDFEWRLSIAQVSVAGPFSAFDGIDRVLAVAAGRLHLHGPAIDVVLDISSAPFAFDGGLPLVGDPLQTTAFAINAMARRGAYDIRMDRLTAGQPIASYGTTYFIALGCSDDLII